MESRHLHERYSWTLYQTFTIRVINLKSPAVFLNANYQSDSLFPVQILPPRSTAMSLSNPSIVALPWMIPIAQTLIFVSSSLTIFKILNIPISRGRPISSPTPETLETLVKKSSGRFIYASTVVRFVESNHHQPSARLNISLGISPLTHSLSWMTIQPQFRGYKT